MSDTASIKARYTYITPFNGGWACFLVVGVQSFRIVEATTKRRAKWYADRLTKALDTMIKEVLDERH